MIFTQTTAVFRAGVFKMSQNLMLEILLIVFEKIDNILTSRWVSF